MCIELCWSNRSDEEDKNSAGNALVERETVCQHTTTHTVCIVYVCLECAYIV